MIPGMNSKKFAQSLTVLAVALCLTACSKTEETTPEAQSSSSQDAVGALETQAQGAADALKEGADAAKEQLEQAKESVSASIADANSKFQDLVDEVKRLIGEAKYSEAMTAITSLSGQSLNSEQESIVESLKKQVEAALAQDAASEAGNALGNILK